MKTIICSILAIMVAILIIPLTIPDSIKEATNEPNKEIQQIVFTSGVENGICLVPNINLWNKPGGVYVGARVIASVNGCTGIPVKIVEKRYIEPRLWYYVKTFGANSGQSGWVTDSFIVY